MRAPSILAFASAVAALGLSACGSSSSSSGSGAASPASSATTSSAASPASSATTSSAASPAAPATASTAVILTKHDKLGTILAYGPKKLTVYMFEADKGGQSACSGACAKAWPPVIGTPDAHPGAVSAALGTVTRPDGRKQVTYKGHPLYLFIKDKDDGDTYGQALNAFGAGWYVLRPSGAKVDES